MESLCPQSLHSSPELICLSSFPHRSEPGFKIALIAIDRLTIDLDDHIRNSSFFAHKINQVFHDLCVCLYLIIIGSLAIFTVSTFDVCVCVHSFFEKCLFLYLIVIWRSIDRPICGLIALSIKLIQLICCSLSSPIVNSLANLPQFHFIKVISFASSLSVLPFVCDFFLSHSRPHFAAMIKNDLNRHIFFLSNVILLVLTNFLQFNSFPDIKRVYEWAVVSGNTLSCDDASRSLWVHRLLTGWTVCVSFACPFIFVGNVSADFIIRFSLVKFFFCFFFCSVCVLCTRVYGRDLCPSLDRRLLCFLSFLPPFLLRLITIRTRRERERETFLALFASTCCNAFGLDIRLRNSNSQGSIWPFWCRSRHFWCRIWFSCLWVFHRFDALPHLSNKERKTCPHIGPTFSSSTYACPRQGVHWFD